MSDFWRPRSRRPVVDQERVEPGWSQLLRPDEPEPGVSPHVRGGVATAVPSVDPPPSPSALSRVDRSSVQADPWQPIVVDRPIMAFEPRPPGGPDYIPDIAADGWGTDRFVVRTASVRGYSHRHAGTVRQDYGAAQHHRVTGSVVLAVADGVSDATRSDLGARLACVHAIRGSLAQLDDTGGFPDWQGLMDRVASVLDEQAQRLAGRSLDGRAIEGLVATTLVVAVVTPTREGGAQVSLARVGDSGAWMLRGGAFTPLLPGKYTHDESVISSAVTPLPRRPIGIRTAQVQLRPGEALLLGTDGFGDPLGDGTGLVGGLFAQGLSPAISPLRMAHLLDFSRETFDDDRTLAVVWPWGG
jgi:serine/threonine protein phosphatase PrpC